MVFGILEGARNLRAVGGEDRRKIRLGLRLVEMQRREILLADFDLDGVLFLFQLDSHQVGKSGSRREEEGDRSQAAYHERLRDSGHIREVGCRWCEEL